MKVAFAIPALFMAGAVNTADAQSPDTTSFKAEKVSRTAIIHINTAIEKAFPLFGAFEERKWAPGWAPQLIYPSSEIIEEGTTFRTPGHGHGEDTFLWRVIRYEPKTHLIEYLVSTGNRYWTMKISCKPIDQKTKTAAEITYTFIGLTPLGNEINKISLRHMYEHDLTDWQDAINNHLQKP